MERIFGCNNELKYQGKPMVRRVHLLNARNKRIAKTKLNVEFSAAFVEFANSTARTASSLSELMQTVKDYEQKRKREIEFEEQHCRLCGSQRCEGYGSEMFEGCPYNNELEESYEKETIDITM